jgi:predicted RNase H-like HicB family nuclease
MPAMSCKELVRLLEKGGAVFVRQKGQEGPRKSAVVVFGCRGLPSCSFVDNSSLSDDNLTLFPPLATIINISSNENRSLFPQGRHATMTEYYFTVVYEPQPEGGFTVLVPALPGCISQGETLEEARRMIKEAIELYIEVLLEDGKPIPDEFECAGEPVAETIKIAV